MIEIYGVPEHLFKCPGCMAAISYCEHNDLEFSFIPILLDADNELGFEYDRPAIEELRIKAGKETPPRLYPQIFVDGEWIGGFQTFKEKYGHE